VFGIGFELMLDALLAVESPVGDDDLFFGGKVRIKIGLPWPLPDIKKDIPFSWGDASALPPPVTPMVDGATVSPGLLGGGRAVLRAREPARWPGVALPLDGRVTITFQRPLRSRGPARRRRSISRSPTGGRRVTTATRSTPCASRHARGSPHDATEDLFGQWTLGPGDGRAAGGEPGALGAARRSRGRQPRLAGPTERRSWVDLLFDTYTTWPCGTLPQPERCVNFDLCRSASTTPSCGIGQTRRSPRSCSRSGRTPRERRRRMV
jgi:hypothetical protein